MNRLFYLISICFVFWSCDNSRLFEKNIDIVDNVWSLQQVPSFEYDNIDTISEQRLLVNIRHSSAYPFSNLWLFIHTISPDNTHSVDTLECLLAQDNGKWLGDGLGDIWDIQIMYDNRSFEQEGRYTFRVEQAMRHGDLSHIEYLPGIMEIGLRIEKTNY